MSGSLWSILRLVTYAASVFHGTLQFLRPRRCVRKGIPAFKFLGGTGTLVRVFRWALHTLTRVSLPPASLSYLTVTLPGERAFHSRPRAAWFLTLTSPFFRRQFAPGGARHCGHGTAALICFRKRSASS